METCGDVLEKNKKWNRQAVNARGPKKSVYNLSIVEALVILSEW